MRMLGLAVAGALACPAFAQAAEVPEKELPAYAPPVADEAHGLAAGERATALHVLSSHYRNLIEGFDGMKLPGRDLEDFTKPAVCELSVAVRPEEFRRGSFEDGLPVRRAQPIVFNSFQVQLVEGQARCQEKMLMTKETWAAMEARALQVLLENSGTTYCREDSDCFGVEIVADPCGARRRMRVFGSNTTDAVFFVAYRKFLPPLLANLQQMVNGHVGQYADKHPDGGAIVKTNACPMRHWEEEPLTSVCVEHSCRAAP